MSRVFCAIVNAFLIATLATVVNAQTKSDRNTEKLFGEVKTVQSQISRTDNGRILDSVRQDRIVYSREGTELERMIFDDYGFFIGIETAVFDEAGNKTTSVLKSSRGQILEKHIFTYTKGLVSEISNFDSDDELILKQTNTYTDDKLLNSETYLEDGKTTGKTVYTYNGGRLASAAFFSAGGAKAVAPIGPCLHAHRVVYEYDKDGQLTRMISYEINGTVKTTWTYSYTSKGIKQEETREDSLSKVTSSYTYEYDPKGNWIKKVAKVVHQPKSGPFTQPFERTTITNRELTYY